MFLVLTVVLTDVVVLQENTTQEELINSLRFVRPGNNFDPKMEMFGKVEVNGSGAHQVFKVSGDKRW